MAISGTALVTVTATDTITTSVSVSPTTLTMVAGDSPRTVLPTAYNSAGIALGGKTFTAQSSDVTKATVSVIGGDSLSVTPVASGTANITAICETVTSNNCVATVTVAPSGFYVSTTGLDTNAGTIASPWSLAYALSGGGGSIHPGATVFLRGGTYGPATWTNVLLGTNGNPIQIKPYGWGTTTVEQPKIDLGTHNFDCTTYGGYVELYGIEFFSSDTDRVSTQETSDPTDNTRDTTIVSIGKPNMKVVNCIIHDLGDAIFSGEGATNLETYGNICYNNGWSGPSKGSGHTLYMQNDSPTKTIKHNILFNSFGNLMQLFGSDTALVRNFSVTSNAFFCAGLGDTYRSQSRTGITILGGGATTTGFSTFDSNQIYSPNAAGFGAELGESGRNPPVQSITFTNNRAIGSIHMDEGIGYVVTGNVVSTGGAALTGGAVMVALRISSGSTFAQIAPTWNSNTYYPPVTGSSQAFYYTPPGNPSGFTSWKTDTGYDASSTSSTSLPVSNDVVVWLNTYDARKAYVVVWNWTNAATQALDLSTLLSVNDTYLIRHVYDWDGTRGLTSYTGTYSGPVTVDLTGWTSPKPIGAEANAAPTSCAPQFNVFIVVKTN